MPVVCDFQVEALSQDEFHAIDRIVMKHAFDVQNDLGRFYDEKVYQNELMFRLQSHGLPVTSEALVKVVHRDFVKHYFLDIMVGHGAVYELKTVDALVGMHQNQLIHYLILLNLHHGKLLNFKPKSVEHRFVSTRISPSCRFDVHFDDSDWAETSSEDRVVKDTVHGLMEDWGSFLDVVLYEEAILYFLGGCEKRVQPLDVSVGNRVVGQQKVCLLQDNVALHISAVKRNQSSYQRHIARLFEHTRLTQIQWINFNQNRVEMITLKK